MYNKLESSSNQTLRLSNKRPLKMSLLKSVLGLFRSYVATRPGSLVLAGKRQPPNRSADRDWAAAKRALTRNDFRNAMPGLVFLQYGTETKRALLPNEITTLDTVRALFVRSFSHQLTMEYLTEARNVRIYIHDTAQDVFYELEDLRQFFLFPNLP